MSIRNEIAKVASDTRYKYDHDVVWGEIAKAIKIYLKAAAEKMENPYKAPYTEPGAVNQKIADIGYSRCIQDFIKLLEGE